MLEKERRGIGTDRFEVEGLEIIVFKEERGEIGETLRRSTTEVVESERGEIFPASVVRIGTARHTESLRRILYHPTFLPAGFELSCTDTIRCRWGATSVTFGGRSQR